MKLCRRSTCVFFLLVILVFNFIVINKEGSNPSPQTHDVGAWELNNTWLEWKLKASGHARQRQLVAERNFPLSAPSFELALVLMLTPAQIPSFLQHVESIWNDAPPCGFEPSPYSQHISIVFFINADWDNLDAERESFRQSLLPYMSTSNTTDRRSRSCFRREILWLTARVRPEDDNYPYANARMFYSLFENEELRNRFDYFFLMEPDVVPVRTRWAERMYEEVLVETVGFLDGFWIKGSMLRNCLPSRPLCWRPYNDFPRFHINGNAFYKLSDPLFDEFLRTVQRKQGYFNQDSAIDMQLRDPLFYGVAQQVVHNFVYTEFIQNLAHKQISYSDKRQMMNEHYPRTFLVHH